MNELTERNVLFYEEKQSYTMTIIWRKIWKNIPVTIDIDDH